MKTNSLFKKLLLPSLLAFTVSTASAVTLDFDVATDFEDNFWAPTNRSLVSWNASGYVSKGMPNSNTSTLVYNSSATGGGSGLAGTAAGSPLDKFDSFVYETDVAMDTFGPGNTFGLYTKLNDAATSGYLAIFRINNGSSQADFRIFVEANPQNGNGLGSNTTPVTTQIFAGLGNFSTSTFYRFRLEVEDIGNDVQYTASIWTTDPVPSQIGNTLTYTFTDGVTGLGQVGLRISSANASVAGNLNFDNYTVNAVPEPAHWAGIFCGLIGLLAIVRRRKRA